MQQSYQRASATAAALVPEVQQRGDAVAAVVEEDVAVLHHVKVARLHRGQ
jgi:ATP-dependent Clp protease adapter protein ClpS